ncbi:MAG: cache domain-containing protein [Thermodesulfobacteriota bacterium]
MFSRIYSKALVLITLIVTVYTGVIIFFVSPKIEERAIYLEEKTGKAHLQEITTVVDSTVRELKSYEKNSIALHKEELENITDVAFTLVDELYVSSQPEAIRQHLLFEVNSFKENLSKFYQYSQRYASSQEMQETIKEFVKLYRYDENTGYFFINQGTSCVLHPIKPALEGKDLADLKDVDGKFFIRDFTELIQTEKQGFVSYKWLNPTSKKIEDKLTYIFYFAPFDWIIGTGVYFEEITRQKQKEALEYVVKLRYDDNEYFYISDYNSVLISHPSLQGRDMSEVTDSEGTLIVPPMVQIAREQGKGFHSYFWNKLQDTGKVYKKLTFAKHIPDWEWIIGTGIYLDSVELEVETKKRELITNLRKLLTTTTIGDTGYIYIFDSKGNMIIHPNSNIEGKNFLKLENPGKNSYIFDDLVDAYKSGRNILYYAWDKPSDKGNYIYDKVSWITYNSDFDWYICSSAYIAEINSTANKLKKYIWITSFILLALTLILSAFLMNKLLKPIGVLSRKALQVKNGDLSVRSQIHAGDEIGTLATTFDGMLDTIENNISTLDHKVHERTKDLQEVIEKLDYLASHDPMTGIYNRRKFFELASLFFSENPKNLCAAMLDIDKFKKINDTYGHPVGDLVIKAVAGTIREHIEEGSVLGRLGGEEFAIICRPTAQSDIEKHFELIRKKIEQLEISTEQGDLIRCTISIGIAKTDKTVKNLDELLQRADELLYEAKGSGRNNTAFRI